MGGSVRRYQCQICGKTFCSTTATPYHRLQHRRPTFDEWRLSALKASTSPPSLESNRIAWNTVHRWLERAAAGCRRFNSRKIKRLSGAELQADEIRTIVGNKEQPIWVFVVINVWSRLWRSTVVGKRSYLNTRDLFRDISKRMALKQVPLITTDGFGFYGKVVGRIFGPACCYGQLIKPRRNDRVVSFAKISSRNVQECDHGRPPGFWEMRFCSPNKSGHGVPANNICP
jgi:hypothetical protein